MEIIDCSQRSDEWYQARLGIPTSSNFDKIVTADGKPSKQRTKYMYQLAAEKITGMPEATYQNAAMLRGLELEQEAKTLYTLATGNEIKNIGFAMAEGYGASPDAFVGDAGLLEVKCPTSYVHISYLLANALPIEYKQQTQGQLLVTGRDWCDFMSYFPGLKPLIVRVERDKVFLKALKIELKIFCGELKEIVKKLR